MTWQGVPWAVGNGAQVPVEAARVLSYVANGGSGGVTGLGDLQVRALPVPGAGVRVMPGAGVVLNRGSGGGQQAYIVRNPDEDTVAVTPTGAGGGRTDLVAVVVEDPQYPGQPAPANVAAGPYVRTRIYQGVDVAVKNLDGDAALQLVAPGQTGYGLAAYTLGASDGLIVQADIVDLRQTPTARTRLVNNVLNLPNSAADEQLTTATMSTFPNQASWDVQVPLWAVRAVVEFYASGVQLRDDAVDGGDWAGQARIMLGSLATNASDVRPPASKGPGKIDTFTYVCAGTLTITKAMRGTTQILKAQALRTSSSGGMAVWASWGTVVIAKVTFVEDVDSTYWEV